MNRGQFLARVDEADLEMLTRYRWCLNPKGYVVGRVDGAVRLMHTIMMNPAEGMEVLHRNADLLDHRRCNLVVGSHALIMQHQVKRALTSSQYKGVQIHAKSGRWRATIARTEGGSIHLGYLDEEIDAARAYDEAAILYYGEDAWTNLEYGAGRPQGYIKPRRVRSSVYKGVAVQREGRWRATLCVKGKRIHLGYFGSEIEAARRYDEAAVLNFARG